MSTLGSSVLGVKRIPVADWELTGGRMSMADVRPCWIKEWVPAEGRPYIQDAPQERHIEVSFEVPSCNRGTNPRHDTQDITLRALARK